MTRNHIAHYLWPLTLAVLLVNVALGYWRSRALVSSGRITAEERASFTRSAVLLSSVYCLVQWSVQAASHTPDPLCLLAFPPHGRFAVASWLVAVSTLARPQVALAGRRSRLAGSARPCLFEGFH